MIRDRVAKRWEFHLRSEFTFIFAFSGHDFVEQNAGRPRVKPELNLLPDLNTRPQGTSIAADSDEQSHVHPAPSVFHTRRAGGAPDRELRP